MAKSYRLGAIGAPGLLWSGGTRAKQPVRGFQQAGSEPPPPYRGPEILRAPGTRDSRGPDSLHRSDPVRVYFGCDGPLQQADGDHDAETLADFLEYALHSRQGSALDQHLVAHLEKRPLE